MFFSSTGQAAVEYLFIVALALMLLIPGSVVFYRFSATSSAVLDVSKMNLVGADIVRVSQEVYSLGEAWETVSINLPDSVTGIWIYNDTVSEFSIHYDTGFPSEVVFFTHVPIFNSSAANANCTGGCFIPVTPGDNDIRIESSENGRVVLRLKDW